MDLYAPWDNPKHTIFSANIQNPSLPDKCYLILQNNKRMEWAAIINAGMMVVNILAALTTSLLDLALSALTAIIIRIRKKNHFAFLLALYRSFLFCELMISGMSSNLGGMFWDWTSDVWELDLTWFVHFSRSVSFDEAQLYVGHKARQSRFLVSHQPLSRFWCEQAVITHYWLWWSNSVWSYSCMAKKTRNNSKDKS